MMSRPDSYLPSEREPASGRLWDRIPILSGKVERIGILSHRRKQGPRYTAADGCETLQLTPLHSLAGPAPLRRALQLWLIVAVVVAARTVIAPQTHTIYPILASATTHWWADRPLYAEYPQLDFFRYPPPFAVAFTPLWALGPSAGGVLWSLLGMGVFVLGLWRFLRDLNPGAWTPTRQAVFLALSALGATRGLWNAQSNALAVGLLLLGAAALVGRRWWASAAWLAASVLLKLTPLAPALLLCSLHSRRLAPRFALLLAVGFLLPFLTRPPGVVLGHYQEWFAHIAATGAKRWPGFRDAWTVWRVTRALYLGHFAFSRGPRPIDSDVYRAVQLLTAVAALAWSLWQRRRTDDPRRRTTLALAAGLAWLMLFGPAIEFPTYVFLTPVLNWALLEPRAPRVGRWLCIPAFVLVTFLGWGLVRPAVPILGPLMLTVLPIGTTLFIAWLAVYGCVAPFSGDPKGNSPLTGRR